MCTETKQPHKHMEIIIAWAKGAEIEQFGVLGRKWFLQNHPTWSPEVSYRVKPVPKPDVVSFCHVRGTDTWRRPEIHITSAHIGFEAEKPTYCYPANVKFIFDGETGKLKAVSLIKE